MAEESAGENPDQKPATTEPQFFLVADVAPMDVDGVRTVAVGTVLWLVGFLALLPFYGMLEDSGRLWWLWTCLTGFALGLFGLEYCRRRRRGGQR